MANMIDYLVWRGDIPFSCSPFNDVDNLILASFAYLMPEKANLSFDSVSIAELALALGDNTEAFGFIDAQSNRRMLQLMGESERFGRVTMNDYRYETDESCEKQFAAMTFYLPDGTAYVAFRGTDNSLVGWKEDFNMAHTCPVPAQLDALYYLQAVCLTTSRSLRVGGHSKGGNLAVYAAGYAGREIQDRIIAVYSNDGPGMNGETVQSEGYGRICPKIISILPEFSIIGMLLYEHERYKTVKSTATGLMQHSAFSWQVERCSFVETAGLSRASLRIDALLDQWLFQMPQEERMQLVEALFHMAESTEAKTLNDFRGHIMKTAGAVLLTIRHFDPPTRHLVWEKVSLLMGKAIKKEPPV